MTSFDPTHEDSYKTRQVHECLGIITNEEWKSLRWGNAHMSAQWENELRVSQGFVLVYNCQDQASFDQLRNSNFVTILKRAKDVEDVSDMPPVVVVGSNSHKQHVVDAELARSLAEDFGAELMFCGPLSYDNSKKPFVHVVEVALRRGLMESKKTCGESKKGGGCCLF